MSLQDSYINPAVDECGQMRENAISWDDRLRSSVSLPTVADRFRMFPVKYYSSLAIGSFASTESFVLSAGALLAATIFSENITSESSTQKLRGAFYQRATNRLLSRKTWKEVIIAEWKKQTAHHYAKKVRHDEHPLSAQEIGKLRFYMARIKESGLAGESQEGLIEYDDQSPR